MGSNGRSRPQVEIIHSSACDDSGSSRVGLSVVRGSSSLRCSGYSSLSLSVEIGLLVNSVIAND